MMNHTLKLLLIACFALLLFSNTGFSQDIINQPFEGLIKPYEEIEIGSSIVGIIDQIHVDRSDPIKIGQALFALESNVEKSRLDLIKARLKMLDTSIELQRIRYDFAKKEYERKQTLLDKNTISIYDRDEAKSNMDATQKALEEAIEEKNVTQHELKQAQEAYQRLFIKSPINGVVVRKYLTKGELVNEQPIMHVAQLDPLLVEVNIPATYWNQIKKDMLATIEPEIPINQSLSGSITRIDPLIDAKSGMFQVIVELPNPSLDIPAGLQCQVNFSLNN